MSFVPSNLDNLTPNKHINVGMATVFAFTTHTRQLYWLVPGGIKTENYEEATRLAGEMDKLIRGNAAKFNRPEYAA